MKFIVIILSLALALPASAGGIYPFLPSKDLTPGDVASTNTKLVCESGYTSRARDVSRSTKNRIYKLHSVDKKKCIGDCKIDHLIPLAIGGSNADKNLWPHEYGAEWTVFMKTRLEVRLRKEVCQNGMPIQEAQQCIRDDWTKCFARFYPQSVPKSKE